MKFSTSVLSLILCLATCLSENSSSHAADYKADLLRENVLPAVPDGPDSTPESAFGFATFELEQIDPNTFELIYEITLVDLDTAAWRGAGSADTAANNDDLAAIHMHFVALGSDNKGTPHVMNVLGLPLNSSIGIIEDDLVIESFDPNTLTTVISGRWDAADVAQTADLPAGPATNPMSDYVDELAGGEIFMMIHTSGNTDGAIGGTLLPVPEPTALVLTVLALLLSSCCRSCGGEPSGPCRR